MPEQNIAEVLYTGLNPSSQVNVWTRTLSAMVPEKDRSTRKLLEQSSRTLDYIEGVYSKLEIPAEFDKVVIIPKTELIRQIEYNTLSRRIFMRGQGFHEYSRCVRFMNDRLRSVLDKAGVPAYNHLVGDAYMGLEKVKVVERDKLHKMLGLRERTASALSAIEAAQPGPFLVVPMSLKEIKEERRPIDVLESLPTNSFALPLYVLVGRISAQLNDLWLQLGTKAFKEKLQILENDFSFQVDCLGDKYIGEVFDGKGKQLKPDDVLDEEANATRVSWTSYRQTARPIREHRLWLHEAQLLCPALGFIPLTVPKK